MNCPKCGAAKMSMDKPVYFNRDNQEGDFLYSEELRRCQICGKVVFIKKNLKRTRMKFVKGQVITGGYENL